MAFNFGAFTQGLGGGMQQAYENQNKSEELKLRKAMIDAQIKHMEAETALQQNQMKAKINLADFYTKGQPGVLTPTEGPADQNGVRPAPVEVGGRAPDPEAGLRVMAGMPIEDPLFRTGPGDAVYDRRTKTWVTGAPNTNYIPPAKLMEDKTKRELSANEIEAKKGIAGGHNATTIEAANIGQAGANQRAAGRNQILQEGQQQAGDIAAENAVNKATSNVTAAKPGILERGAQILGLPPSTAQTQSEQQLETAKRQQQQRQQNRAGNRPQVRTGQIQTPGGHTAEGHVRDPETGKDHYRINGVWGQYDPQGRFIPNQK